MTKHAGSYLEHFPPERLVYLSSDSSELLTSLEAGTAYGTNPNPTLTPTPTLTLTPTLNPTLTPTPIPTPTPKPDPNPTPNKQARPTS